MNFPPLRECPLDLCIRPDKASFENADLILKLEDGNYCVNVLFPFKFAGNPRLFGLTYNLIRSLSSYSNVYRGIPKIYLNPKQMRLTSDSVLAERLFNGILNQQFCWQIGDKSRLCQIWMDPCYDLDLHFNHIFLLPHYLRKQFGWSQHPDSDFSVLDYDINLIIKNAVTGWSIRQAIIRLSYHILNPAVNHWVLNQFKTRTKADKLISACSEFKQFLSWLGFDDALYLAALV